ncbi:GTPase, partial [Streptococcus canis]
GRNVYVVGVTNVGKSTLINAIIQEVTGDKDVITTSRFPGTTLDKIEIPLDDGTFIFDTPGIIHRHQMAHYLSAKDLKVVSPKKEIKPKTYQLNPEQTLFLGGLARFDFISGERQGFTAFFDNELGLHRTKLTGADTFYDKHLGGLLTPPGQKEAVDFPKLVRHEFVIDQKMDLVFSGLGWIRINGQKELKTKIAAWAPEGVAVLVRKAII